MKAHMIVTAVLCILALSLTGAAKSTIEHLYLYEKNSTTWEIVPDGAWGKLKYNTEGATFNFVFNGHHLEPKTEYALIYYADKPNRFVNWGGDYPGAVIAIGTSNRGGNLNLVGSENTGSIPSAPDQNIANYSYCAPPDNYENCNGGKIWLIPTDTMSTDLMGNHILPVIVWAPERYLFESDLINYTMTP